MAAGLPGGKGTCDRAYLRAEGGILMSRQLKATGLSTRFSRSSLWRITLLVVFSFIFLSAQNGYSAQVKLAWDANTEPALAGYKIYVGASSRTYDYSVDVGNSTEHTVTGLADGQTYYLAATAYDTDGNESGYSNEVNWMSLSNDFTLIPQSELSIVFVDSEELSAENGAAENVIDGRSDTFWHTEWSQANPEHPHDIIIDIGNTRAVAGVRYLPRQNGTNGTVADYAIYLSEDGLTWGEAVATGAFANDSTEKERIFAAKRARYVRFVALSEVNGRPWTCAAEINIIEGALPEDTDGDGITDDDETDLYGTDPNNADTDNDGIDDGDELAYWQDNWDADFDNDGIINLLDPDSDGDDVTDGEEIELGTDPAEANTPDYALIPQSELSIVFVNSEEVVGVDRPAENAIDGRPDTFWHTEYSQANPKHPHDIIIDIGNTRAVAGVRYLPRQDGEINGTVADYAIYLSEDGLAWGEAVATGAFANDSTEKERIFAAKRSRYVRFVALSEVNGRPWTCAAEISILRISLAGDTDGDGIIDDDETGLYGTDPNNADTDNDGINDGDELAYWQDNWNADFDNDGIINLLDPDSDEDGVTDGEEIKLGTDPAKANTPDYALIPQSEWSIVFVNSEETVANNRAAENAIDGRPDTFWHTEYSQASPEHPHGILIDLGNTYAVAGFRYLPRQDGGTNGTVADFSIYLSENGLIWKEALATGTFASDSTEKERIFDAKRARYVCFVALSEVNGNPWTSMAEINILGSTLP
jgi:hypothetical protein